MMLRWGVMGAACLVLAAAPAIAGDKVVYAPVPDWVKPADTPDPAKLNGSAARIVIFDQQHRVTDAQLWQYVDSAQLVGSTEMLKEIGTLALTWQPDKGDLIIHRLEILRRGEIIDLLKSGQKFEVIQRERGLEQQWLNGQLTATLAVEGLRVGDVLRLSMSTTSVDTALAGNVETTLPLVALPTRVGFGRARLLWNDGVPLVTRSYVDGVKLVPQRAGGFYEVDVPLPIAKLPELPADSPIRYRPLPIVEASSFADWAAVSKVMAPLYATAGTIAPGSGLASEVARIRSASADPLTRAAMALQLVQGEIRYLYRGMDGGNYRPQTPEQTWSARYGDCKAKTLLLLALLDALEIDAEAVLVSSQLGDSLPNRLPSVGAFDHVIVHARISDESLWLDGTLTGQRIEDIRDTPYFHHVLPLRAAGAGLMALKARSKGRPDAWTEVTIDQSAGVHFPAPVKISMTFRGDIAERINQVRLQGSEDDVSKLVEQVIKPFVESGTISGHKVEFDTKRAEATIQADGLLYPDWTRQQAQWKLPVGSITTSFDFSPDRARTAWKAIPVTFGRPGRLALTTRLKLPDGGKNASFEGAADVANSLAGVRVRRGSKLADGWLTVEEEVENLGSEIAAADIGRTRDEIARAKAAIVRAVVEDPLPRWRQAEKYRSSKRFDAIFARYDADIADAPDTAEPYYNRAWFKSSIYDWAGAIADMSRAVEIERSAAYLIERATLYEAAGQEDKALEDLRAALELEPGSLSAISRLAEVEQAELADDVLAMIDARAQPSSPEGRSFLRVKANLLSRIGEADAAIAAIDAAVGGSPNDANLLNARCWVKATMNVALDTALTDCNRAIELGESPASALDSRALVHLRMGKLDLAMADLDAALDLSPELSTSLYMRGVVQQRQGKAAAGNADVAASRLVWPPTEADMRRWGVAP